MRTLVYVAIGFTLACIVGIYVAPGMWLLPLALFTLAALLAVLCVRSKTAKCTAVLLLGLLVGIMWMWMFDSLYLRTALENDNQVLYLQAEVTEYSYAANHGSAAECRVVLDGKPYKVKLYLKERVQLCPGDRLCGNFLMRYTADGGSRAPTYHQGKGVFLLGYPRGSCTFEYLEDVPARYFPRVLARQISELLRKTFPPDALPFAQALLLGDDTLLNYETDKALQMSGLRHVIAVSGLHVSILFGFVYTIGGKNRVLTALIGIPVLVVFAAVAGFTPSIVRACVMQSLMILGMLLNREYDPPTALALAVLIILGINPVAITSVSFQLSVASMLGILLFAQPMQNFFLSRMKGGKGRKKSLGGKLIRWIAASVSISLATLVTTTPLCAYYFGFVSLVSIFTNLLTLWLISFIFIGIIFVCVLGGFWLPLGKTIAWILSWPIGYVLMIARFFSGLPYSVVYTSSVYIVLWLVFCYGLLTVFLRHKKKHPALFAGCIVVCLCAAIACTALEHPQEGFSVTVMDVGQGQCVLLQSEEEAYLVDCGNAQGDEAADIALRELWKKGITCLDGIIVTHYDKDHADGVNGLVNVFDVETVYLPDSTPDNELRQQIVRQNEEKIVWVRDEAALELHNGRITIYPSEETDDTNESSLCILFQVDNCDILITGDRSIQGEEALMEAVDLPELELLVVGHHGSRNSTGFEFLKETRPITAVISVGDDNSYGHPAEETLERLRIFGCNVLRTDLEGTITFRG